MARDARDLAPLLQILAGKDGLDPQCHDWGLGDPAQVVLSDVVVHPVPANGRAFVRAEVRAAVEDAAAALVDRGASRQPLRAPDLGRAFEVWGAMLSQCADRYDAVVGNGVPIHWWRQVLSYPFGPARHTASALLILGLEKLLSSAPGRTAELAAVSERLRAHLETTLGPRGVMIHPVVARTAPRHRAMLLSSPFDVSLTTAFNITAMPATVVPIGLDRSGLPLAVQIVARRGNDHLCLAVAMALQDAFGRLPMAEPRFGRSLPFGLRLAGDVPSP